MFSPEKLSIILNNDIFIEKKISSNVFDKVYTEELSNKITLEKQLNKMSEFYSNTSTNNKAVTFIQHGKIILMGGFFDGKVLILPIDGHQADIITPFKDESPILAVTCDKDDEFIFMGNQVGNVCIFKSCEGQIKIVNLIFFDKRSAPQNLKFWFNSKISRNV